MKHVLECDNCNADLTKPLDVGTEEHDYTFLADLDFVWDDWKPLVEREARFVKVLYWTGYAWGDGEKVVENRYWLQIKEIADDVTSFPAREGQTFQCRCGKVIGVHVGLNVNYNDFWENQYVSMDPKVTSWTKYIDHGKKRKAAKKKRIKVRKKNNQN